MEPTWPNAEELAKQVWISGAAELMIPNLEASKRWEHHKTGKTQIYLNARHTAMEHLLAIKKLEV